jgi:hypothetical protein
MIVNFKNLKIINAIYGSLPLLCDITGQYKYDPLVRGLVNLL